MAGWLLQVVGRSEPHNMELVHPKQDRVMTIRENARAQVCRIVLLHCFYFAFLTYQYQHAAAKCTVMIV